MDGCTSAEIKRVMLDALTVHAHMLLRQSRNRKYGGPDWTAQRAIWRQQARLSLKLAQELRLVGDADLSKFIDDAKIRAQYAGLRP